MARRRRVRSRLSAGRYGLLTVVAALLAGTLFVAWPAQAGGPAQGLDVSYHQNNKGPISWPAVKDAGQSFVFLKATEGQTYTDPVYLANNHAAMAAGLVRGAYHFARPDSGPSDAVKEARHFMGVVGAPQSGQLPPVLDLESTGGLSPAALAAWTRTFLGEVERISGRVPIIYTGPSFWETKMANSTEFTRFPLWLAHYTSGTPRVPGGWPHYTFWQNSSTYSVPGITGAVDHNYFQGTIADLQQLAGGSPNPHAPTDICGAGYDVIDQAPLGTAGTAYLLSHQRFGGSCVVAVKNSSVGTESEVSAYVEVQGGPRQANSGSFGFYAGPVWAEDGQRCITWGGSVGAERYDSPREHCG